MIDESLPLATEKARSLRLSAALLLADAKGDNGHCRLKDGCRYSGCETAGKCLATPARQSAA